jgi:hypothetical protein
MSLVAGSRIGSYEISAQIVIQNWSEELKRVMSR